MHFVILLHPIKFKIFKGNLEDASREYSKTVINWKGKVKKDLLKTRKSPPCSSAFHTSGEDKNISNNTIDNRSSLCSAFNEMLVERNLKVIMEIMKFSLGSPTPFSLKDMAALQYHHSDDYRVLFPNGGNLTFLQKLG